MMTLLATVPGLIFICFAKITITAKDPSDNAVITNSTTNDAVLQLTFTSNHETDDFVAEDVTVSNGSITPLTQLSNNVYTATHLHQVVKVRLLLILSQIHLQIYTIM